MVLSMLSAIQNVKLPPPPTTTSSAASPPSSQPQNQAASDENLAASKKTNELLPPPQSRAADMSRRKQRNPKPIFNPAEEENDQEEHSNKDDLKTKESSASEDESIHEDLHSMVKVEVHETSPPPPASTVSTRITPPPSTSGLPSLSRMPPLHLPPPPNNQIHRANPDQMVLNQTADMLAKQNMFCFGDVTVADHPDAPPVPMVIPMVYLYPLPSSNKENIKYRMFVPLGAGLGPELLVPPPPQTVPTLPKLEKIRPEGDATERRSGDTTPLDLSKSPESHGKDLSDSETDDQRLPSQLRRASKSDQSETPSKTPPMHPREIEAQLQFLKAKQLEFLKDQHQKQAVALAAAQAAAVAAQQKSRCEECNINFSKHQNYIAHKKYYCSSANNATAASSSTKAGHPTSSNASSAPLPILSDNDDDKSSDDGKSQRKLSPPIASPALMIGLTSPTLKDRKNDENAKDPMIKSHDSASNSSNEASKPQISPSGLLIPPGITTPPLPHFVCEGCGIKFKSVSNLQAHQARYCAGLRKASEDAFEAMMMKQKQQAAAAAAAAAAQQKAAAAAASLPMLEMMSLLNAKSAEQEKLSSLMMSSMAAAAMQAAASANGQNGSSSGSSEDYCCILCGYKEQSVDRLKDHINLHFIGQVKRKASSDEDKNGNKELEPQVKKLKVKEETAEESSETRSQSPGNDDENSGSSSGGGGGQLKCNSCDIGFSHLSNFVAHKKYYCRGLQSAIKPSSPSPIAESSNNVNGKESPITK